MTLLYLLGASLLASGPEGEQGTCWRTNGLFDIKETAGEQELRELICH